MGVNHGIHRGHGRRIRGGGAAAKVSAEGQTLLVGFKVGEWARGLPWGERGATPGGRAVLPPN